MRGPTARVERLVRAYAMVYGEELHPVLKPRVATARVEALRARIAAVLPLLTPDETASYYALIRRMRESEVYCASHHHPFAKKRAQSLGRLAEPADADEAWDLLMAVSPRGQTFPAAAGARPEGALDAELGAQASPSIPSLRHRRKDTRR